MNNKEKNLMKLLKLKNNRVSVHDIEYFLGIENYAYRQGSHRVWVYENNATKTMIKLTIEYDAFSDIVNVINVNVYQVGQEV